MAPALVRLRAEDLQQLRDLLRRGGLPEQDCGGAGQVFYGIFLGQQLVGAGGLEAAGESALLRSVVVAEACRGQGLAQRITEFLIARARDDGQTALYLLTENAAGYFERFGFEAVPREAVPPEVAATRQFAELCPQSAVCLGLRLGGP